MKRIRIPRVVTLLAAAAVLVMMTVALAGCGGTPLEKAAKDISSNEAFANTAVAAYDSGQDILAITAVEGCDLDTLFETLNANIQDQEIGGLYFIDEGYFGGYYHYLDDGLLDKYSQKIGEISCAKMGVLALDGDIVSDSNGGWTAAAAKADKIWLPDAWDVSRYEGDAAERLKDIHVLWTRSTDCAGACKYPNLEELAICDELQLDTQTAEKQTEETEATEATEASEESESSGQMYELTFDFDNSLRDFRRIKEAKNLQRLLIAPSSSPYKLNQGSAGYIYAICNFRPDMMINPPEAAYSADSLVRADSVDIPPVDEKIVNSIGIEGDKTVRNEILTTFLKQEVEPVYKTAKKFEAASKDPKINGKALVYIVDPYQYSENDWPSKRQYNSDGKVLLTEVSGSIKVPEYAGDYDTFIFGYPVFKQVGKYTSGTKAYSQTYNVQVFDLKNKVAYKVQTVGTVQPENKFSYSGSAPDKHSGIVPEKKVIKFIKDLK